VTAEHQPWVIEALTSPDPPPGTSQSRHPSTLVPDTPGDWVRANLAWDDYLPKHGWTGMRNGYWCRPGKNPRDGHSAELHDDGRLAIWTGEVPDALRQLGKQQSDGGISVSLYDFIAAYEFAGDRAALGGHVRAQMMPQMSVPPPRGGREAGAPDMDDGSEDDFAGSWFKPVSLTSYFEGTHVDVLPTILRRTDGVALFYPGVVNGIHGEPSLGKSWVALAAVVEVVRDGGHAIYVDLEDTPKSITSRLRTLGVTKEEADKHITYVRPTDPTNDREIAGLRQLCLEREATLVVIDSLGEAFSLDGINENNDSEVAPWLRKVGRRLADTGACIVVVDHVTKAVENPLYAKGSARKLAQIGGSAFFVEVLKPLTKGQGGKLRLTCAKDRNSTYTRGKVSAEMVFSPSGVDDMIVRTYPVGDVDKNESEQEAYERKLIDKALVMMQVARDVRVALTKTELCDRVAGNAKFKYAVHAYCVRQGQLVSTDGGKTFAPAS